MIKAKINKYIEYGTTKIKMLYKEKVYRTSDCELKYILEKGKNSKDLIVVFSGIPRVGVKARYNYMRTLEKVNANKLFILDDLGHDERGGYYLGKNKDFYMKRATLSLIDKIKKNLSIDRTIYCGSSKGGWAALYYGIRDCGSSIVAGSLQYLMGNYVTRNERITENLMKFVMGKNYTDDDVVYLNDLLKKTLEKYQNNECDIHLHYSDVEYTYEHHMQYLLRDLKRLGFRYAEDIQHYERHDELSLYFPPFLLNKVTNLLKPSLK